MDHVKTLKHKLKVKKEQADELISKFQSLIIEDLPLKGNSCSECQRLCIQQALNELSYAMNGLDIEDLKED